MQNENARILYNRVFDKDIAVVENGVVERYFRIGSFVFKRDRQRFAAASDVRHAVERGRAVLYLMARVRKLGRAKSVFLNDDGGRRTKIAATEAPVFARHAVERHVHVKVVGLGRERVRIRRRQRRRVIYFRAVVYELKIPRGVYAHYVVERLAAEYKDARLLFVFNHVSSPVLRTPTITLPRCASLRREKLVR